MRQTFERQRFRRDRGWPAEPGSGAFARLQAPAWPEGPGEPDRPAAQPARYSDPHAAVSSPDGRPAPLADWMDTHRYVLGLWLDRLIETGDPDDLISMVHRQYAWLNMMREQVDPG